MPKLGSLIKKVPRFTARIINHAGALTNPRYRKYWRKPKPIDSQTLKPGDIFLTRNPESIRNATGSFLRGGPFTHAFIYIGEGKCVETRPAGVKIAQLDAVLKLRPEAFAFRADLTESQRSQIVDASIRHGNESTFNAPIARNAAKREAIGIPLKSDFEGVTCSSLVADVYHKAGVELIPGKNPKTFTPNSFIRSKKLTCINC
jgi:cell wall-associated NlpC family hydrolase